VEERGQARVRERKAEAVTRERQREGKQKKTKNYTLRKGYLVFQRNQKNRLLEGAQKVLTDKPSTPKTISVRHYERGPKDSGNRTRSFDPKSLHTKVGDGPRPIAEGTGQMPKRKNSSASKRKEE